MRITIAMTLAVAAAALCTPGCTTEEARAGATVERAVARVLPVGDSGVEGVVRFERSGEEVRVTGRITGLSPGPHGFHVHQFGDLSDTEAGQSAGGHFAPRGRPHGRPAEDERHIGDLGNIEANDDGVAEIDLTDPVIELNGPHSIVGRAIVIHAGEDQFVQPTGDAGSRVGFGAIGIAKSDADS